MAPHPAPSQPPVQVLHGPQAARLVVAASVQFWTFAQGRHLRPLLSARTLRHERHPALIPTDRAFFKGLVLTHFSSISRGRGTRSASRPAGTRKIAAVLVADIRLAGADEERTLARLRALRSDLIDPISAIHHGHVVKRTGDGALVQFRSVVDALHSAIEVQNGTVDRRP
jgi:class 3 adenylate cyclase